MSIGRNPWHYDWDSARWVYLETKVKSRPAYIGFVDEDEGPRVYLLCPVIRNREGRWVDSWTWREEVGPLSGDEVEGDTVFVQGNFGEVIVYKWDITKIKPIEDDHAPEFGRCWFCGKKIGKGRFCEDQGHEAAFKWIGLDQEML